MLMEKLADRSRHSRKLYFSHVPNWVTLTDFGLMILTWWRIYSHRAKAGAKTRKIKESKKNFVFDLDFARYGSALTEFFYFFAVSGIYNLLFFQQKIETTVISSFSLEFFCAWASIDFFWEKIRPTIPTNTLNTKDSIEN